MMISRVLVRYSCMTYEMPGGISEVDGETDPRRNRCVRVTVSVFRVRESDRARTQSHP